MPEVLDPGQGKNRVEKFKEEPQEPPADAGWRGGVSPAVRKQYWEYLRRWKEGGERGRRWTLMDVALANRKLAEAVREVDEEKAAGYRRFLLMGESQEGYDN